MKTVKRGNGAMIFLPFLQENCSVIPAKILFKSARNNFKTTIALSLELLISKNYQKF